MIVITQLKRFGIKYYLYIFLQRLFVFVLFSLLLLFLYSMLEYRLWLSTYVRKLLFFSWLLLELFLLFYFLMKALYDLLKTIFRPSYIELAKILSDRVIDIKEPLFNLVFVHEGRYTTGSEALLARSIEEQIQKVSLYQFEDVATLRKTLLYFFVSTFFFILFFLLTLFYPDKYARPLYRIFNYEKQFQKPCPFTVKILNKNLTSPSYTDFSLKFAIMGNNLPEKVYLLYDNHMLPVQFYQQTYSVNIPVKDKNIVFKIQMDEYVSEEYTINVLAKPTLYRFQVTLFYPPYINKINEKIINQNEINVPRGTTALITLFTRNVDKIVYYLDNKLIENNVENSIAHVKLFLTRELLLSLKMISKMSHLQDTLQIKFNVLPDLYPKIEVRQSIDSFMFWQREFWIHIADDYGFSKLSLVLQNERDSIMDIPIRLDLIEQEIYFPFEFSNFVQNPLEKQITYYFKVCDNDPLFHGKCTNSKIFTLIIPSDKQIEEFTDKLSTNILSNIDRNNMIPDMHLQKINNFLQELYTNKQSSWQQSQKIDQLINEQQQFVQEIDKIKQDLTRFIEFQKIFNENSSYEKLLPLLDQLNTKDLENILREIEKMLEKSDQRKLNELLEQLKEENKQLKDMLEQLNQIYKQTYVEENLKQLKSNIENLSKEQEKLSQQSSPDEFKEQQQIHSTYNELMKKLDTIQQFNQQIQFPYKLDSVQKTAQDVNQFLENLSNQFQKEKPKQLNQQQKRAAEQMQELANQIKESIQQQNEEQHVEDEALLINLLKLLVKTSFDQENLFKQFQTIKPSSPAYAELLLKQKMLDAHLQTIEDSIKSLAKRNPLIDQKIRNELKQLQVNRKNVSKYLNERNTVLVSREQQFIMMHINNLALLLAEVLKQAQQEQQNNMNANMKIKSHCKRSGKGSQNKPTPNPQMVKKLQEELNQQIQKLKEQMQKGEGGKQINEELMKAAFQQEAIRKALQEYVDQLKGQGEKNTQGLQKVIDDMEKTERDLINKQLDEQTIIRLNNIMVRLLESEKAEMQKEFDPKRESRPGKDINNSNPFSKIEYKEIKKLVNEQMKNIPLEFNVFYRKRISEYYQKLK